MSAALRLTRSAFRPPLHSSFAFFLRFVEFILIAKNVCNLYLFEFVVVIVDGDVYVRRERGEWHWP